MNEEKLSPIHPGEVLLEEFLRPLGISQYQVARDISVPPRRINEIVHCERAITADTALRLARYFGTSERFWLNLQTSYDVARRRDELGEQLEEQVRVRAIAGDAPTEFHGRGSRGGSPRATTRRRAASVRARE